MKMEYSKPYGTWPSPITSDEISSDSVRLGMMQTCGDDVYWVEGRPQEKGRGVLVCDHRSGERSDVMPRGYSVRSRVHEYGGGDFVVYNGVAYFSNDSNQCLYKVSGSQLPERITEEGPWRYADGCFDAVRQRILCVVEWHKRNALEPENFIASVDPDACGRPRRLLSGNDFYSNPRVSPNGSILSWLSWNHPNLPWDGTELWIGEIDDAGNVCNTRCIAGGPSESVFQPQWSDDGQLYFVSDRTGWWNLYAWNGEKVEEVLGGAREMGLPQWVFGMSTYACLSRRRIAVAVNELGIWHLVIMDRKTGAEERVQLPYSEITSVCALPDGVAFIGGTPQQSPAVIRYSFDTGRCRVLRRSAEMTIDTDFISFPQHIIFSTGKDEHAHGFYYSPTHPDWVGEEGENPPLIVKSHGGPTSAASTSLDPRIQFWTSRGFAVLDVNYRGSSGFGRAYREKLNGAWGIADVEDCMSGARFLATQERADKRRFIITGGSAGGYTTLAALSFHDLFKAGASYYGVSDLEGLIRDTHKFEARYLDRLVGPYPENKLLYRERSPIHHADQLSCPVILFQGREDKVVPPNQAEGIVDALKQRGVPVTYVLFDGEGHGFRQGDNIRRALDAELYFYGRVFGFIPADVLDPVVIHNLPEEDDHLNE